MVSKVLLCSAERKIKLLKPGSEIQDPGPRKWKNGKVLDELEAIIETKMEDDPELAALRAQRMAELQQQMGGGAQGGDQQKKQQESQQREAEMKNSMLSQILDQNARARLNSIALVKPEKAKMLENMLIQMAQRGQLSGKMNEEGLKNLLGSVSQQLEKSTKVTINRRRYAMDSDEDDY